MSNFLIPDDLWAAKIDPGQISQVINNLVINAKQAMPEGGAIEIAAENVVLDENTSPFADEGKFVKISIKDEGVGIPKEHISKIFDPFYTTKAEGSGLGLTTSYSILKKHNGFITVESESGMGATFSAFLPASEEEISEEKYSSEIYQEIKGKFLIMDDEKVITETIKNILEDIGCEVETAAEGNTAIELYKNAMETNEPFDVVILDLTIPGGMGGKETIEELRKLDPDIKAIVSSGYFNDPVMSNFKEYGFGGVITKPFKFKKLVNALFNIAAPEK